MIRFGCCYKVLGNVLEEIRINKVLKNAIAEALNVVLKYVLKL